MVIYPEVIVTPDTPTVKFHQPREQVDLDRELPRILHTQGWGCGTYFNVQFLDHTKRRLLACARFVVTEELESINVSDINQYQTMTKTVVLRRAERIGEWWELDSVMKEPEQNFVPQPPSVVPDLPVVGVPVVERPRRGRPPKAA